MSTFSVTSTVPDHLISWYRRRRRNLPWREAGDAYSVWVSEIMLQQTRVEAVLPYYDRFMERFPDVAALAAADQEEVLKYWAGLGYYRRARMLHQAAGVVCERRGGRLPDGAAQWKELPGVGEYTAAAIASISAGERVPVVDGNVKRVAARYLTLEHPADKRALHRESEEWAAALMEALPEEVPAGDLNQALMELGATVCTPRSPKCAECPIEAGCAARAAGSMEDYPRAKAPTKWVELSWAVLLAYADGCALLWERKEGWCPGMYEPPVFDAAVVGSIRGRPGEGLRHPWLELFHP